MILAIIAASTATPATALRMYSPISIGIGVGNGVMLSPNIILIVMHVHEYVG